MVRQGSGAIVNNASVGALTGNPGIGSYIASKHGVVGLTRTAALEYIKPFGLLPANAARQSLPTYLPTIKEIDANA